MTATSNAATHAARILKQGDKWPKEVRIVAASALVQIGATGRHLNALAMNAHLRWLARDLRALADGIDALLGDKRSRKR